MEPNNGSVAPTQMQATSATALPSVGDLNDKYEELIAKINLQTHAKDQDGEKKNEGGDDDGQDDNEDNPGQSDKLKKLYDASVSFKNNLATLRGNIKSLNAKTTSFTKNCDDFQRELDQLLDLNKQLQEEKKKEGPKSVSKKLDLDHKHKQMQDMQGVLVGLISANQANQKRGNGAQGSSSGKGIKQSSKATTAIHTANT